ncbi:MAG: hypothetical protein IJ640_00770 [Prevotella sp.]|nr:hypothetical protein [Prevotella sp.]
MWKKLKMVTMSKPNQCCGECAHYYTGGYACSKYHTPLHFALYSTDGRICGGFKQENYGIKRDTTI